MEKRLGACSIKYGIQGPQKLGRGGTENTRGGVIFGGQWTTSSTKIWKGWIDIKADMC